MSMKIQWEDADGHVDLLELPNDDGIFDYSLRGGVTNNAVKPTGNVVFTTTGYDAGGDGANFTLEFKKKSPTAAALQQDASPSIGSITFTGATAALVRAGSPTIGSIAITGAAPTVGNAEPGLGSIAITGTVPTPA
jgi:hypothetical protein